MSNDTKLLIVSFIMTLLVGIVIFFSFITFPKEQLDLIVLVALVYILFSSLHIIVIEELIGDTND